MFFTAVSCGYRFKESLRIFDIGIGIAFTEDMPVDDDVHVAFFGVSHTFVDIVEETLSVSAGAVSGTADAPGIDGQAYDIGAKDPGNITKTLLIDIAFRQGDTV